MLKLLVPSNFSKSKFAFFTTVLDDDDVDVYVVQMSFAREFPAIASSKHNMLLPPFFTNQEQNADFYINHWDI